MMSGDKQNQKAGDNSQLVQVGAINIINGVSEEKVRQIFKESFEIACKEYTMDAQFLANERVQHFEESLVPKLMTIEEKLNVFADPSFQLLLKQAQISAAASERNADYDMLSELLVCRIEKGQSRKTRAGISRAVEIIYEIDDDALCALTVSYAVRTLTPSHGLCREGVEALANLFEKLMYMELPSGRDWIEHLDILDTVRINSIGSFNKLEEYCPIRLEGYSNAGIEVGSENHKKALELLSSINISPSILVTNELYPNYIKLPVVSKKYIRDNYKISRSVTNNDGSTTVSCTEISEKEIAVFDSIWELYTKDEVANQKSVAAFMEMWNSYPSLQKLRIWWNALPCSFDITHVGRVLANTNARRCDKTIPELPLAT